MTHATTGAFGPGIELKNPAFVHPSVQLFGHVRVGNGASLWPNVVVRAESHEVVISEQANVQDFTMIHVGYDTGTYIGAYTSIAHRATIHGCTIGDNCLIGIGAIVMDGAEIGDNSIVGAGAVVTDGTKIPANSVVVGAPAKAVKTRNNWVMNRWNAWLYAINGKAYAEGYHRRWSGAAFAAESKAKLAELHEAFAAMEKS